MVLFKLINSKRGNDDGMWWWFYTSKYSDVFLVKFVLKCLESVLMDDNILF